ncbi:MAG: CapA family protein, partial [Clostridia bacterium]|nr:CapA family protein [Clostridia bacterium]
MKLKNVFKIVSIALFIVAIAVVSILGIVNAPDNNPTTDNSAEITDSNPQDNTESTDISNEIKAVSSATVTVVGDVLPHTNVYNAAYDTTTQLYNFDPFFEHVTPYLTKADYAVANLEVTLAGTEGGRTYSGYPRFNCPDSIASSLKNAGFDLAMTANNHCYDTNLYGLQRTLRVLSNQGLNTLGTVYDKEADKYLVKNINDIKIGMISYTYETGDKYPDRPSINGILTAEDSVGHINSFDYNQLDKFYTEIQTYIASMKAKGAEAIVVYI